jgi:hypothetical protein
MITKAQCTQWIAALRGGKYRQGRRLLRSDDQYCCLGVLGDLMVPKGAQWTLVDSLYGTHRLDCTYQPVGTSWQEVFASRNRLPPSWLDAATQQSLINMNDSLVGFSFPEIADYIERTVLPELED